MLTAADKLRLRFYSPVGFLRAHQEGLTLLESVALQHGLAKGEILSWENGPRVFYRHLDWDSRHFGIPVYRVEFASCANELDEVSLPTMSASCRTLLSRLSREHPRFYIFAEVPAEDLLMLQALGMAGFRLIETRVTYYREGILSFDSAERYSTRLAEEADVPNLMDVARRARNAFDRYHADPFFPLTVADDYLATYVANAVRGFADMVMVPAPDAEPPGAFLAGVFDARHEKACSMRMARIALTAVAPERSGWNKRLNSELMHWFKSRGTQMIYTTTQSTNRAAIHVLEALQYCYGRSSHVFSYSAAA